jgi:ring-1,2-phenylacetyl-CoA epoxidase subunit PaaE
VTFDVPTRLRTEFDHAHGQHVVIAHAGLRRTYSICTPAGSGVLRVAVKRLPGGAFSGWAHDHLRAGDQLAVSAPAGRFTTALHPTRARRYAAIAAGSGITPIMSIAATILEREPQSEVAIAYGNRTTASIMFLEELQDLKNRHPERFEVLYVLSREPQAAELLSGRLDRARLTRLFDTVLAVDAVDVWLLCGPLAMTETARALLRERGVPADRVLGEVFYAGAATDSSPEAAASRQPVGRSQVTAILDGRRSTTELAGENESILDALLRVRGDAPYACKGGVCGTCRAKVISGAVRMDRTYALEEAELAAGYVLACQAHPRTERVVLDFDR